MFRKILYPTDLSNNSEVILRGLYELKRIGVSEVVLAHIVEYDAVGLIEGGVDIDKFVMKLKNKAGKKLSEFASILKRDFEVKLLPPIPSVNPVEEIVKIANNEDVSLILLGSKSSGLKSALMGSVSEGVVREVEKPILVLKMKPDTGEGYYGMVFRRLFDKIIYPHDLSDISQEIKDFVKKASLLGGREVIIVHVVEIADIIDKQVGKEDVMHPLVPISNLAEMLSEHWMEAKNHLDKIKRDFVGAGIKVKTILRVGSPNKEIPKIASMEGGSVIMISSKKGLTPNVDPIIRYSEIPTIVFRS